MVIVVHVISQRQSGLADETGSTSGIVIISTFGPTLLAVSLVLQIGILYDDIQRTEPFARLAAPGGAPADQTLLWTSGPWWNTLRDSFPNKHKHRGMSWMLLFSTLVYVLGFLVVSPFSSTLFVSKDVLLSSHATLKQLDLESSLPLQIPLLATTWFRALSGLLQNATTSTWFADEHVGLPFWAADIETPPVGPILGIEQQTWEATTTIFSTEMPCEAMTVDQVYLHNVTTVYPEYNSSSTSTELYVNLSSASGCSVSLENPTFEGYALWTSLPAALDGINSTGCTTSFTDLLFFATPMWGADIHANYVLNSTYKAVAYACKSAYYVGNSTATVHLNDVQTNVTIDESEYISNRRPIRDEVDSLEEFQEAFFSTTNWTNFLGYQSVGDSTSYIGPASLLASIYGFSIDKIVADTDLLDTIWRIRQRFFAETLFDNFDTMARKESVEVAGTKTIIRRRLITVPAVAIILEVTFGLQLIMLLIIFRGTRMARRPLGLKFDPMPISNLTTLLARDPATLESLRDREPGKQVHRSLSGLWFHTGDDGISLVPGKNAVENSNKAAEEELLSGCDAKHPEPQSTQSTQAVLRLWVVCLLAVTLAVLLAAIATLYRRSSTVGLYETAFVYGLDVTVGTLSLHDISPASLVTTLVAVCVGKWWQSTETALRHIQPFLALSEKPIAGFYGTSVSYGSSYLLWSASKAVRRRHWMLGAVSTGAFLVELCKLTRVIRVGVLQITRTSPQTSTYLIQD